MKNYGPINSKMKSMLHGGDYNPDQWRDYEGIWDEDFRLMELSKCNAMSIGIFSWMSLEPLEGEFDFEWMDEIMDRLAAEGRYAVLATPSGARPAWLSKKYPEVLRVNADRTKNLHGFRHNHCYTSPAYREKVTIMNTKLAERYKDHPALLLWHISNEYGGECHCELCQEAFREWLKVRYENDINKLNHAWWTGFWAHTFTDWSQIESPSPIGENKLHGHNLDWKRFVTYQMTDFMKAEMAPIRAITPDVPITTNFMGTYEGINYWEMAKELDVISWDNYPLWHGEKTEADLAAEIAFVHDINRCHKQGKPFMLMESTPSMTNWQPVSKLKRPGMHLLSSMQAVAHGSDTVQYFQWRKSRGSFEKFHGAVVDHCGHEHTRVFRDVASVGQALSKLDEVVGTSVDAKVAVIYDWENRWAIDDAKGLNNSRKNYLESVLCHYKPFWKAGVPVDVIDMTQDLSKYDVVIAPMLYMLRAGVEDKIKAFVEAGGTLVTTYASGMVNETDLCFLGGFPGPLKEVVGVWNEETDGLYDNDSNTVKITLPGLTEKTYDVNEMAAIIHCEEARSLGSYEGDFYAGQPALTVNDYGKGKAYYIAFRNNDDFEQDFYSWLIKDLSIEGMASQTAEGVSVQIREDDRNRFIFLMNFNETEATVELTKGNYQDLLSDGSFESSVVLDAYGVRVLKIM